MPAEETARNQAERNSEAPPEPGAKNRDGGKKPDPARPSKLTVDQYLKYAPQSAGIGELVRSLYKTKVMSFEEWESTVKTLLKKQVR